MSWSGAIPLEAEQSDSEILIDACLERVRKDVGLDDESASPPLDVLIGKPVRTSPSNIEMPPRQVPCAEGNGEPAVSKSGLEPRRPAVVPEPLAEVEDRPAASH